MGNLFARFQSPRPSSNLHSSGIVGDDTKIGATSSESFAERQQINKNRQFVGAYQDAGVLHNYRKDAHEVAGKDDANDKHHRKHHRSQEIPRTARIDTRPTSRVDAPRTPRADVPVAPRSKPPAVQRPQAGFAEPTGRRYNPYS